MGFLLSRKCLSAMALQMGAALKVVGSRVSRVRFGGAMCTGDRYVVHGLVAKWAPDGNTMCYILDVAEDLNAETPIVVRSANNVGKALNTRNARAVAWQADPDGNTHHRAKKRSWQE